MTVSNAASAWTAHRRACWAVAYRITGTIADADEIVQETAVKALTRPPADTDRPWGPWLVTVAANLARDRLRARRRRGWVGPWLPSPVPDDPVEPGEGPDRRAERHELATYAWLVAAERLTPAQRAVLVLREAADLNVAETAEALGMSAANVKVVHHRARRALGEVATAPRTRAQLEAGQAALGGFLFAISTGDVDAARAALDDAVVVLSDGGGRYAAARVPIIGAERVIKLYQGLGRWGLPTRAAPMSFNGHPGFFAWFTDDDPHRPPRWALVADVGAEGRILRLWSVLVPEKLPDVDRAVTG
jgi:RNA polymerase sigma-70 factor (ECF subfamily)